MSHSLFTLHAYRNRGRDVRVFVETPDDDVEAGDFSDIEFIAGDVSKTGLTGDDVTGGFNVDFTLTASDLNMATGRYDAELKGTKAGEPYPLAIGTLHLDDEPTS